MERAYKYCMEQESKKYIKIGQISQPLIDAFTQNLTKISMIRNCPYNRYILASFRF